MPDPRGRFAAALPPETPPLRPGPDPNRLARPGPSLPAALAPSAGLADLTERLLDRRIVLVGGVLDEARATRAAAQLMLLDADGQGGVELHLRCPDGDLDASATLAHTVELMHVPVRAVASGCLSGAALAVYAAADLRVASPTCLFQLKEPTAAPTQGRYADLEAAVRRHERLLAQLRQRLAAATSRTVEQVGDDLRSRRVLAGQQVLDYGLAHQLA